MLKDDKTRLWHMLDAAREALSFAREGRVATLIAIVNSCLR
ncbi:MAG: hypothetical protein OXF56_15530 [Rhodobacteraceae bacterium]|nr:hypothetical protein [Paracoccaceae bacterium]